MMSVIEKTESAADALAKEKAKKFTFNSENYDVATMTASELKAIGDQLADILSDGDYKMENGLIHRKAYEALCGKYQPMLDAITREEEYRAALKQEQEHQNTEAA